ncbi:MAG: UDP-N-acetylmuramate:L-alanyl-gamma-D-glutamyl-meso-diaminopimelate ligase [Woeseiaceae bacterium]
MHIHILGICGTFMGGIAALAKASGHRVSGCDSNVYPPMSTQLESLGIELIEGWNDDQLALAPDVFIVGNVVSRGNPLMEAILNAGSPYTSGPQWLSEHVLRDRHVIAVAGTHGKTTTTSLIAHLLEETGHSPGFLIGGVPGNFDVSARLGKGHYFVVEADEYDTAFFDKRAKFVHYRPQIAVLNNLEFDHADIYSDLAAIEWQFHQLLRMVPGDGHVIVNGDDKNLERVLEAGCWTPIKRFSTNDESSDATDLRVLAGERVDQVRLISASQTHTAGWAQQGSHNRQNTAAALLAVGAVGVDLTLAANHLSSFASVSRRMQCLADAHDIRLYDDFAHHPTAIRLALDGAREAEPMRRLVVAFEPRSNTMQSGVHAGVIADAFAVADEVVVLASPEIPWDVGAAFSSAAYTVSTHATVDALYDALTGIIEPGGSIILMSNGAFGGLSMRLRDWVLQYG